MLIPENLKNKFTNSVGNLSDGIVIGIALSGGLDSVVLFELFRALTKNKCIPIHINHNLRAESSIEQRYLTKYTKSNKSKFLVKKLNGYDKSINLEKWAREQRYEYFKDLVDKNCVDIVAIAHHQNDLIETYIFKLMTNRTSDFSNVMVVNDPIREIFRPLMSFTKDELELIAELNKFDSIVDISNFEFKRTRSKIRHIISNEISIYNNIK